jgi:hypothetical protein
MVINPWRISDYVDDVASDPAADALGNVKDPHGFRRVSAE